MTSVEQKMLQLGNMVFGMITDVLVRQDATHPDVYARRTITTPDGRGGKHEVHIIIVKNAAMADLFEQTVAQAMPVDTALAGSEAKN